MNEIQSVTFEVTRTLVEREGAAAFCDGCQKEIKGPDCFKWHAVDGADEVELMSHTGAGCQGQVVALIYGGTYGRTYDTEYSDRPGARF